MLIFQKNVVSLQRAFAELEHQHCWKQKTLEVYWVSETAKSQSPENRQPVSVYIGTDYCCYRGKALGGAEIPRRWSRAFFNYQIITKNYERKVSIGLRNS